jgi:cobalt-zinc-cadmium efflux system membrane fusion protein
MSNPVMTNKWALAGALLAAAVSFELAGCAKTQVAQADSNPAPVVETVADRNLIPIQDPARFALANVLARMEADQVQANGIVAADVSRTHAVNALSGGRVLEVRARLGDDVQAGQTLLTLVSPDMQQAIADYQKFQAAQKLAELQLDRANLLLGQGVLAKKDFEVAEDAARRAGIDTQAAAEHIRILGGDPEYPSSVIQVPAPVAGTVIEQNVTTAAGVKSLDNSPNLFTIADLSTVWVLVDVYENDLAHIHAGDRADLEFNAYPNRFFRGQVTNISKVLDPNTRSAKVRIELPNAEGLLRPNMFAVARFVAQGRTSRLVVPASAVFRLQDRDWAYVKVSEKQFRKTEVQLGGSNPDRTVVILSGLRLQDQVVQDALLFDRDLQKAEQ